MSTDNLKFLLIILSQKKVYSLFVERTIIHYERIGVKKERKKVKFYYGRIK